jgi:Mg-chelatase subunit ChlD
VALSRRFAVSLVGVAGSSMFSLLVACGSSTDSTFRPPEGSSNDPSNPDNGSGDQPTFDSNNDAGLPPEQKQCAASTATAEAVPVNLVFMFDQSGSMGGGDRGVKWDPVTSATTSFFGDAASKGIRASLQYFPQGGSCSTSVYENPEVALTDLPNTTTLASSFAAHDPGGSTPTLPALTGALAHAATVATAHPGEATAVVLVTDGDPDGCGSEVQNTADAALAAAATTKTYVIGVGASLTALDQIAASGGTQKAILVNATNAAQANTELQAALAKIRGATLSCSYQMPAAPAGQTLDIATVNVNFTPTGGAPQTLAYNKDCTGGTGWHYDNANAPTKVEICKTTCDSAQADKSGKIDISVGCATKGGVVR